MIHFVCGALLIALLWLPARCVDEIFPSAAEEISVSTDLSNLDFVLRFPTPPVGVRRCATPVGIESWAPGPMDYRLYIWLEFDQRGWKALESQRTMTSDSTEIPANVARALFWQEFDGFDTSRPNVTISGPTYDLAQNLNSRFRGASAVRKGNHLLVQTSTM